MTVTLPVPELAYAAALIDTLGTLSLRDVGGTRLPNLTVQARHRDALAWLGRMTDTRITEIKKDYNRAGCGEHCPEAHVHIVSVTGRWVITGVKATIVLHNVLPFLLVQRVGAIDLVTAGQTIGYKGNVVEKMRNMGWEIPDLKPQPRMRKAS